MQKIESILFSIVCCGLFFLAGWGLWDGADVMFGRVEDFYEKEAESGIEDGDYVSLYVDGVLGNFAETTTHKYYFIPVGKDRHYIIWLDDQEIISLTVSGDKKVEQLDTICDATWDYLNGISQVYDVPGKNFRGRITKPDSELKGYMNNELKKLGITEEEFRIYPLTIDTTETPLKSWILFLVPLLLAIILLCLIVRDVKMKKEEERRKRRRSHYNINARI